MVGPAQEHIGGDGGFLTMYTKFGRSEPSALIFANTDLKSNSSSGGMEPWKLEYSSTWCIS